MKRESNYAGLNSLPYAEGMLTRNTSVAESDPGGQYTTVHASIADIELLNSVK